MASVPTNLNQFQFTIPVDKTKRYWLLTIMSIMVEGKWEGRVGEHFVAWAERKDEK